MTHKFITYPLFISILMLTTHCSQEMNQAEIDHQEVSMAQTATEQLLELDHEVVRYGNLPANVQRAWDQAKADYLSAAESLTHAEADSMNEALETYHTAWDNVLSTYQFVRKHFN
ncbi:hypothetical protein P3T73_04300 [Kiritimatiellota bacterium B12222]|nr:hypothetical protein P3T73_04300 [Kiritimatiellota bacterium B12222]